jgi:hypothetical protein
LKLEERVSLQLDPPTEREQKMSTQLWPDSLFDLIFIPHIGERLEDLTVLAEPEEWNYQHTESEHPQPILYNYLHYTYQATSRTRQNCRF